MSVESPVIPEQMLPEDNNRLKLIEVNGVNFVERELKLADLSLPESTLERLGESAYPRKQLEKLWGIYNRSLRVLAECGVELPRYLAEISRGDDPRLFVRTEFIEGESFRTDHSTFPVTMFSSPPSHEAAQALKLHAENLAKYYSICEERDVPVISELTYADSGVCKMDDKGARIVLSDMDPCVFWPFDEPGLMDVQAIQLGDLRDQLDAIERTQLVA